MLVTGCAAQVTGVQVEGGVAVPLWSPQPGASTVSYCQASLHSVGLHPLTRDPYEALTVAVRQSGTEGGGQGLFAARDITEGEVVAFYNGIRLPPRQNHPGVKEDWDNSGYKVPIITLPINSSMLQ